MSERNPTTQDTVIIRTPGGPEIGWRTRRMVRLGADAKLAAEVAASDVDVHDIERLLKAGCSLELAWTITQPVDAPAAVASSAVDGSTDSLD